MTLTPEQIAGELSESMKISVLSFAGCDHSDGHYGMIRDWFDVCQTAGGQRSFRNTITPLVSRGLAENIDNGQFVRLTRLGLQVRAILQERENG